MKAAKPGSPLLVLAAVLMPLACASSGGLSSEAALYGSPTAEQAVRTFLDAARQRDYRAMGRQFGTRRGPAERTLGVAEVEQRMVFLSGLLRHRAYTLERRNLSRYGADRTAFIAEMTGTRMARRDQSANGTVRLPIVAISTDEGRWFVEQIDVESLSSATVP